MASWVLSVAVSLVIAVSTPAQSMLILPPPSAKIAAGELALVG
jgi:hypothetical protein